MAGAASSSSSSLISTGFLLCHFPQFPKKKATTLALSSKSHNNKIFIHNHKQHKLAVNTTTTTTKLLRDSFLVVCTSVALSFSLLIGDVDSSALAFVITTTTPRKLQSDELATVRLFQENTPSVVYITNLAVRYASFSFTFSFLILDSLN